MLETELDIRLFHEAQDRIGIAVEASEYPQIYHGLTKALERLSMLSGIVPARGEGARGDIEADLKSLMQAGGFICTYRARPDFKIWGSICTGPDEYINRYAKRLPSETLETLFSLHCELAAGLSYATRPINRADRRDFLSALRRASEIALKLEKRETMEEANLPPVPHS